MHRLFASIAAVSFVVASTNLAQAQAQTDTLLAQIKQRGTLRVCEAAYPPYNVKNPKTGEWEGLNVDIIQEIAQNLNVKIETVDSSFPTLIPSLQTQKCDISAAATYATPSRAEQVLFTTSYAAETKVAFVPVDSPIHTYADLDKPNITITTRSGTAEDTFAKRFFKQAKVKPIISDATQPHLIDVAAGRSDAAFAGYTGSMIFLKQNPNLKLRPIEDKRLDPSPIALMLPAKEYQFQQYLNVVLNTLQLTGKLQEITDRWEIRP